MRATVAISSAAGHEMLSVHVDDFDPFVVMTVRGVDLYLTRDESRRTADALRAAALREDAEQEQ